MYDGKLNSLPLSSNHKLDSKHSTDVILTKIPYTQVIESLMYVMVCSKPILAYFNSVLNMFVMKPRQEHWNAVKGFFRYIKEIATVWFKTLDMYIKCSSLAGLLIMLV